MTTPTIVFDLDGTIANTSNSIIKSFNQAFKKNGLNIIDQNFFLKNASNGSLYFIKKNLKTKQYDKIKDINDDFLKFYKFNCDKHVTIKKGLRWFLKKNKKNYKNIVCTNKDKKFALKILKKLNIHKYFYDIVGHGSFKHKKPSKELFKLIFKDKYQDVKPIIIGDSEIDYKFAKNSNSFFVLVKDGYTTKKVSQIIDKYSIDNFFELDDIIKKIYK